MKKFFTILFALTILYGLVLTPLPSSANNPGPAFSIGTRGGVGDLIHPGDTNISVPVNVSNNPGFSAVVLSISYSRSQLELVRVETAPQFRTTTFEPSATNPQLITIVNEDNPSEFTASSGTIASLVFNVLPTASPGVVNITYQVPSAPDGSPATTRTLPGQTIPGGVLNYTTGDPGVVIISSVTQGPDGPRPPGQFGVTMAGGGTGSSGAGWYTSTNTVNISAGTPPTGMEFAGWTSSPSVTFANASSPITSFLMPANDVTVTANWRQIGGGNNPPPPPAGQFQLRVVGAGVGGTQTGNHAPGATVTLNAGTAPAGQTFVNWTRSPANGGNLTNPTNASTASITLPTDINAVADRIITVTANWSGGGGGGNGGGNGSAGGGIQVISHFGTFTGSGTRAARVDEDNSKFVRLLLQGNVVAPANYTVTAGSTVITLTEDYLGTFANGTYTFRAEFTDGFANLTLIVSRNFGNVPQTGIPSITGTVITMWMSIFMTAVLGVCLVTYIKFNQKNRKFGSDHEDK